MLATYQHQETSSARLLLSAGVDKNIDIASNYELLPNVRYLVQVRIDKKGIAVLTLWKKAQLENTLESQQADVGKSYTGTNPGGFGKKGGNSIQSDIKGLKTFNGTWYWGELYYEN